VWAWTKVFGVGALGFRSLSAFVGTLTVPVMYLAGLRISRRAGVWAAALTAVNPAMYYFSQEARCYALLILLSAAAFVMWQRALQSPDSRSLILWSGFSILALLTHYFAAFLFIPEAVVLARRLGWRRVRVPAGAVLLVGLALLPLALAERSDGKSNWIGEQSLPSRFAHVPIEYLVGDHTPLAIVLIPLSALLAAGAVALLIRRGNERERRLARDVAVVAVVALALPALLAVTRIEDVFNAKNVIAAWVPCAVLIAIGLGMARAGRTGPLLGAGLCVISLLVIVGVDTTPGYQRDDWRGVTRALRKPSGERVIVVSHFASLPVSIYIPAIRRATGSSVSTREVDFAALRTVRTVGSPEAPVVPTRPPPGFRLAEVHRTESFAISRFVATRATSVGVDSLRRSLGEPEADIILQP
jgi:mannosyltransferase